MTRGEHGHPESEGYGTTHVEDVGGTPSAEQAERPAEPVG
jgi:hypothetical protein